MQIIDSIEAMSRACASVQRPLGLVPTMGSLHQGHLALVRQARADNPSVAVSIFVNPSQFAPQEDLSRYPRNLEQDLDLLRQEGVDLVFTPSQTAIYPPGFNTWVDVGEIGEILEGETRPGHFRGVATVVSKLFNIVAPDRAYFGQKDGQQTLVIRQMVRDLDLALDLVVVPTVREPDGLALSSRNAYLTPDQRKAAPVLYLSLLRAKAQWNQGVRNAEALRQEVRKCLEEEPLVECIDYVSVADAATLAELESKDLKTIRGPALVLVAVKLGIPRLIDNIFIE